MKRILFFTVMTLFCCSGFAQNILIGTDNGLYELAGYPKPIFTNVKIKKIIKGEKKWLFLTDRGVLSSPDLHKYKFLNDGLPKKTLKVYEDKKFVLKTKTQELKDLEKHNDDSNILITATNNNVFLSIDGGHIWQNLGNYGNTNGLKAVAVTHLPDRRGKKQLTVFVSHSIYGVAWKQPFVENVWHDLTNGLERGAETIDEVSDIAIHKKDNDYEVFVSQTFQGKIFKLNWSAKKFEEITENIQNLENAQCVDSISVSENYIIGVKDNDIFATPLKLPKTPQPTSKDMAKTFKSIFNKALSHSAAIFDTTNCIWISDKLSSVGSAISLSELWLLRLNKKRTGNLAKADKRKGIYIPTYKVKTTEQLDEYIKVIEQNNLNTIVIDMKDDFGYVRYDSNDEFVKSHGGVRPFIQVEEFVKYAKEHNIYLVARLVVFKDRQLYYYNKGKYAVKDRHTGNNWQGYLTKIVQPNNDNTKTDETDKTQTDTENEEQAKPITEKQYFQEYWVDPYNSHVWEYNTAIANELIARGFDEIQFDYIRFPTDGENLGNATYPAKEPDMDKESALMSFLAFARSQITAPISIDIYGANGWYRTGARTGQEVEMLTHYVDVICPMYYPSHFSQGFLAYPPAKERPYRIYNQGSLRNRFIARNQTIIRPWAQAFYINVSYDRKYYGKYYVHSQTLGIADSIDEGYIYWNNLGNYKYISPDGHSLENLD